MSLTMSARSGRPVWKWLIRAWCLSTITLIAVGSLGAQQFRKAPKFDGKTVPEPPSEGQPWTAPATKLPKFLVEATGILFEQGVADPRCCEYRLVEIANGSIVKAHAFALPERADAPVRFVVCWDGQVYPALTVGGLADLDRDINDLAVSLKRSREAEKSNPFIRRPTWAFPAEGLNPYGLAGVDDSAPIKLCILLRIGRADLAEAIFAGRTPWTPEPRDQEVTDYKVSYQSLAIDWAGSANVRLARAHGSGDDVIVLDVARRLAKFRALAAAKADALGFPATDGRDQLTTGPLPRFHFLSQLDDLLRDQERRAQAPPREPIPRRGGDPTARIAALIRDLDQIEGERGRKGSASPANSPLVNELVAEGGAAVAPLLEVLESDNRLTRTVSDTFGRSFTRFVHPVHEAAYVALARILKSPEFDSTRYYEWKPANPGARKALASTMRRFWKQTR